ncbi:enoyl-CoA hydratase-related protein [Chloroflexota bacterium]
MANDKILYEKKGKTAIITINRPEAMNAYDSEASALLAKVLGDFLDDPEVWTIIVTGAGEKAFSSGFDMKEAAADYAAGRSPWGLSERTGPRPRSFHFGYLNKPTIAAINGYCVGGGLELAMGCDIRITAEHATFEVSEIRRGMLPGISPAKLPRLIPLNLALELLLTARRIDAQEAYRIGLVNKVVPLAELMPAALAIADEINTNAPLSVRAAKEIAWKGLDLPFSETLEKGGQMLRDIMKTEDSKEGTRAFVEKRTPVWKVR